MMKLSPHWYHELLVICLGCGLSFLLSLTPLSSTLTWSVYDMLLSRSDPPPDTGRIVVAAIDGKALDEFEEPLVLWHRHLAAAIRGAVLGGAGVIGLDIIPTLSLSKIAPELDRQMMEALRFAGNRDVPVIMGFSSGPWGQMPHRKFLVFAARIAFLDLYPDADGRIRTQPLVYQDHDGIEHPAISEHMARIVSSGPSSETPTSIYIDFRMQPGAVVSIADIENDVSGNNTASLEARFKDTVVLIGTTSPGLQDTHAISNIHSYGGFDSDSVPGILVHAAAIKTILSKHYIKDLPFLFSCFLWIVLGIGSAALVLRTPPAIAMTGIPGLAVLGFLGIYTAFHVSLLIPAGPITCFILIPAVLSGFFRYGLEFHRSRRLRRYFKSYVHPQVVRDILDHPESVNFDGEELVVTVMFTDIRNFSTFCEHNDPKEIVVGLNRYFTAMTEAIIGVKGYLNRIIGDGILALFGAPNRLPDDGAWAAVKSAVNMFEALEDLNKSTLFPGVDQVRIGIGIHTGKAVIGNIGCEDKREYSIVGDTANLAARIEGLTKTYKKPLLISQDTYERVKDRVDAQFVVATRVKGRKQFVNLYEILSLKESS